MTAKSFVDTNVVLYTIGKDARNADIARELVGAQTAISTLGHVLIVASALLAGCDSLYSEDLQHGQVFDGQLTVVNPFLGA
jgi:predicted nucleic acid-binding protein